VVTFGLAAVSGLYVLVRGFAGRLQASFAVLALLAMPSVVYWTRQAMLEMPTLAVLIWSAVAACHYRRRPGWAALALWIALSVAAVMFKQTALFVFVPYAVLILVWAVRRQVPAGHVVVAAFTSIGAVGTYFILISSGGAGPHVFDLVLNGRSPWVMLSAGSWLTYARWLPGEASWWSILPGVLGCIVALRRADLLTSLAVLWLISFYTMSSLIQHKEPRYLFFGLLPLAVWAGVGTGWLLQRLPLSSLRTVGVLTVSLLAAAIAFRQPMDYRPDYGPLVLAHNDDIRGQVVLFDGLRDADFIFAVRQHLGPRKCVVVRASKLLYACAANPYYRFESYVDSVDDVGMLLRDFAFDAIVVERYPRMNLKEERLLRESLRLSADYALSASQTVAAGPTVHPTCMTDVNVDVYLPVANLERQVRDYDIPIPMDNRIISVSLDELLADIGPAT
jgi:hypothetical protein